MKMELHEEEVTVFQCTESVTSSWFSVKWFALNVCNAKALERTCAICGKSTKYCPSPKEARKGKTCSTVIW